MASTTAEIEAESGAEGMAVALLGFPKACHKAATRPDHIQAMDEHRGRIMLDWRGSTTRILATLAALLASAGAADAAAQAPTITGNSWVALAIIGGLVLLILLFISGTLRLSQIDDTSDEEDEGVGVFEGIEEDDPKPRRRR
jgi:hypothetical protein